MVDVDENDLRRARRWLARHRAPGREPSPLLTARLAVREQARQRLVVHLLVFGFLLIGFTLLREFVVDVSVRAGGTELMGPVLLAGAYLLMAGSSWWLSRWKRRAERSIAEGMPRRVAHSAVRSPGEVLGGPFLLAAGSTYIGGVALGLGMLLFSTSVVDRALGVIFAAGTLAVGVVAAVVAGEEVRRPALAEDDETLAVDDLLRTEDAHYIVPFPVLVALVASTSTHGAVEMTALLAFTLVTALLWTATYLREHRRPLARHATVDPR
ncbi:hypothetical protein [Qaidamihabitans albus]|uniref:hypothetical protein n=1 Tax=Qaidamihabitans albus TaxID=2795733 RepID=UPI0018F1BFF4|nr:hypothetical protein [Qaidamihabitans albus]